MTKLSLGTLAAGSCASATWANGSSLKSTPKAGDQRVGGGHVGVHPPWLRAVPSLCVKEAEVGLVHLAQSRSLYVLVA